VSARLVDPEDDLAAGNHAGDLETTRLRAPYGGPSTPPPGPSTGYGLLHEPEPLPYVQPTQQPIPSNGDTTASPGGPVSINAVDAKAAGRRGTQDLGLLVLRVALGAWFVSRGLQKAFGWWGGPGLQGFKKELTEAGYQQADLLTYLGAGGQIAAGVLLILGLFTPVAGAVGLALLVSGALAAFHSQTQAGLVLGSEAETLLVLAAATAAVVLAGPGRYGFDGGRGWARRPFIGSFIALLVGVAGGVAAWVFLRGNNPFA
jgi:putative oxidoreductase